MRSQRIQEWPLRGGGAARSVSAGVAGLSCLPPFGFSSSGASHCTGHGGRNVWRQSSTPRDEGKAHDVLVVMATHEMKVTMVYRCIISGYEYSAFRGGKL